MNELERIVREAARLEAEGSAYLLATVVRVAGSSYRRPGARMLVAGDRSIGMRVTVADRAIREGSRFLAADRMISTAGAWDRLATLDAAAEPYIVIMHHQRDTDREALAVALASRARYIGVLGPARRTHELLGELGRRPGADPRVHAPIGVDLGVYGDELRVRPGR